MVYLITTGEQPLYRVYWRGYSGEICGWPSLVEERISQWAVEFLNGQFPCREIDEAKYLISPKVYLAQGSFPEIASKEAWKLNYLHTASPGTDHFFRGYECVGRTVGYALVLFGNIGLYYYSEKSIACMLTVLFLGFFCLCTLFYIQPFTDFGVLDFFLSASLTQALSLFGLHIYSWLVFIAVMVIAGLRYQLEKLLHQPPREVESGRMANADSEGEARDMIEVLQPRREVELERIRSNIPHLRIPKKSGRDSELTRDVIDRDSERIVSRVPRFQNLKKLDLSGTVGYALLLFGNIGLYYNSEKSIACMLTFLFLGFYCLCALFYIQPFTDFGVLDFFLSASLTQALSLFGLHVYPWLVFIAVIAIAGLRYQLELVLLQQLPRKVESGRMANADSEGEARDMMECDSELAMGTIFQPRIEVKLERIRSNVPYLRIPKKSGRDSELATKKVEVAAAFCAVM
ncbi:hypothetical protein Acr_01g0001200 [Actinidia rufa]|uniref:Uncharacterized protein n=1 Tax=Actinidia rufa TaxID=165716 RepID=A0A7J0E1E6_9ERIC|nr:hypothetical protein Acr_01g0001200 [Actinidia rufa]